MTIREFAVCDNCADEHIIREKIPYGSEFDYQKITSEDVRQYIEKEGWTLVASRDEEDPVAVNVEHYCPTCSKIDQIFDSGDRV